MLHIILHFLIPFVIAFTFYRNNWIKVFLILLSGMIVDLDHLISSPIYDPLRCSIGYHPLHTIFPIIGYLFLFLFSKTRLFALGLSIHMLLDLIDCKINYGMWFYRKISDLI
ncbi:MAG: hypothetical protein CBC38_07560 [Gammaproteobacteria bacterium TMED78]|nr:MAG: hypothetical protein CBC38_07560 [Gammaproteobacteria bacterium TMED78]|tara:strand:- start:100 stop:435 length:336 start_codon:yes stop_codon:yes gene_type:complete